MHPVDAWCLAVAGGGIALFIVAQCVVFRRIPQQECVKWLDRLLKRIGVAVFLTGLAPWLPTHPLHGLRPGVVLWCALISTMVYGLGVYLYALYVFGVAESSLRVRILQELARARPQGLTLAQLLMHYNETDVVKKRLARFVHAGDVAQVGDRYVIKKRWSVFWMQDQLITALRVYLGRPYRGCGS